MPACTRSRVARPGHCAPGLLAAAPCPATGPALTWRHRMWWVTRPGASCWRWAPARGGCRRVVGGGRHWPVGGAERWCWSCCRAIFRVARAVQRRSWRSTSSGGWPGRCPVLEQARRHRPLEPLSCPLVCAGRRGGTGAAGPVALRAAVSGGGYRSGWGQVLERVEARRWSNAGTPPFWNGCRCGGGAAALVPGAELVCVLLGLLLPLSAGYCIIVRAAGGGSFSLADGGRGRAVLTGAVGGAEPTAPARLGLAGCPVRRGAAAVLGCADAAAAGSSAAVALALTWGLPEPAEPGAGTSAFSQTLQTWEQGRFIRFHGLGQWLAGCLAPCWPAVPAVGDRAEDRQNWNRGMNSKHARRGLASAPGSSGLLPASTSSSASTSARTARTAAPTTTRRQV